MRFPFSQIRPSQKSIIGAFLLLSQVTFAQNAQLTVDASQVLNRISPLLYGSCIEDVNHEIYGGLYDQKIFGESFEEPSPGLEFSGFNKFEGTWNLQDQIVSVDSWSGAKMISKSPVFSDGSAEVDVRFTGVLGENAGFVFHVSAPGNGADAFNGYEISLMHGGKRLRLGKHQQNYTFLQEVDVTFNHLEWTNLKVVTEGARIRVYVNKSTQPAMDFTDSNNPVLSGAVGLRTWNSDVQFKNLLVTTPQETIVFNFQVSKGQFISNQWDAVKVPTDSVVYAIDMVNPYNGKNSQTIHYVSGSGKAGIANQSLNRWGIAVKEGQTFQGRLYLRAQDLIGQVTVALQSKDGTKTYATQTFNQITENWVKYAFNLTSSTADTKARFVVLMENTGKLWVDQVVLLQTGEDQFKGLPIRADIGNAMVAEGLTFLRYGGTMVNAPEYRFKKMIGDPDKRIPYKGHWNRYSTNGFGIEDFLKYSEKAGFTAAFAINIEETATDAADMVEYLNGDITTVWGAKRAANGHPEPFNVKYIEIGNEEVLFEGDDYNTYVHYIERFNALYEAMHAKDTTIKFIHSAWWRPGSAHMKMVFDSLNGKASYMDFHPWADDATSGTSIDKELTDMQNYFLTWDPQTTMKCVIFEENGNLHNMQRALGHATTLNAVRKHSDFVFTSCPANALQPYLQNDNGWDQGQIFFTPSKVWGMPPFYAQQMASENHLPLLVSSSSRVAGLNMSATKSETGDTLLLHVVNTSSTAKKTIVSINGFSATYCKVETTTLSGALNAVNTLANPELIKPVQATFETGIDSFSYSFPAYSYSILCFVKTVSAIDCQKNGSKLKVAPNPANNHITVSYQGEGELEILDTTGNTVLLEAFIDTEDIDISRLNTGIYFIRLKEDSRENAIKFLKL